MVVAQHAMVAYHPFAPPPQAALRRVPAVARII
jgi:hypothetical protein